MPYTTGDYLQSGAWFAYHGHQIFYKTEGTGEPLVLLHGFPTSSWDWHKVWRGLAESFRVITLDFIGFGFSDKPVDYHYSMMDQADLVEKLLAHLQIRHYHLLTHDVGDTVAQELLARQLERNTNDIRSCCLLNGGLFPETHRATRSQKLLLGPFGFWVGRLVNFKRFVSSFTILFPVPTKPSEAELRELFDVIVYKNGTRITHQLIRYILERRQYRERWLTALQKSGCPLRLIDGLEDPVSGAHMVARYRELISNPDVVELPDCGHYPQMEMPEVILKMYFDFRKQR